MLVTIRVNTAKNIYVNTAKEAKQPPLWCSSEALHTWRYIVALVRSLFVHKMPCHGVLNTHRYANKVALLRSLLGRSAWARGP